MRLACICGSFNRAFAAGSMDLFRFLEHCARTLRVAGVEVQDIHFPETRPRYLDGLRRAAADLGLAIVGIGIHNDFGRADTHLRISEVVKARQWVEVAERLGAPQVRVFAGWPDGPLAERRPAAVAALREAAAFAAQAGVRLGLENEGAFVPDAAAHLGLVEEVGSPGLRLLLDTGNYPGDRAKAWASVEQAAPAAAHVHAKFWQVGPDGAEPTMAYPRLLGILRDASYQGWLTFEYEGAEAESTAIPRAFGYLRGLVEQAEAGDRR